MNRVRSLLVFWGALGLILNLHGLVLSQTNPAPPLVHFTSSVVPANYIHDHSTAQIGNLRHQHFHFHGAHTPGLTISDAKMTTDYRMESLHYPGSGVYQVWAKEINVDFSCTRMDVYISSQYGEGSCPYKVIRDHENMHVAINTRTLQKYAYLMKQALLAYPNFPTQDHPWKVSSQSQGQSDLKKMLSGIIDPIYHQYAGEVPRANSRIDTPENYRKTQALCQDW
jgi:hypothetical protein